MTTPFPEPDSPENERLAVYARMEIIGILRKLAEGKLPVNAYFGTGEGVAVVAVLDVKPDFEEIILDPPSEPAVHRRLLTARKITFVAFHESIKLQFVAQVAESTSWEDRPAFRVPLPDRLLRFQRRETYRVKPPVAKPAQCLIPHPLTALADPIDRQQRRFEALRVLDISVGGLALLNYPHKFDLPTQKVLEDCMLDLPGIGSISLSLLVRHVEPHPGDDKGRRCGCEFVDMSPSARMSLQRYVNKIEADQRKLAVRAA